MKRNYAASEFRLCSIYLGLARIFRTILVLAASGSIRHRYRRATTWQRRRFFGKASLVLILLTCRRVKASFRYRAPRTKNDLSCPRADGDFSREWYGRKAKAVSVSRAPIRKTRFTLRPTTCVTPTT